MRLIVGIGNPGKKYELTRHNAGFIILDALAAKHGITFKPSKKDYYIAGSETFATPFFLMKPSTYVNLSGVAVLDFLNEYSVDIKDILVVADDVNLELGKIRLRKSGSDGGHNGLKSIIYSLADDSFPRLRFGIGNDFDKGLMADFVLSKFSSKDLQLIEKPVSFSVELIEKFISDGYKHMLDHFSTNISLNKPISNNSSSEAN